MFICDVVPSTLTDDSWFNTDAVIDKEVPEILFLPLPNMPYPARYRDDALRLAYEMYGLDNSSAYVGARALSYMFKKQYSHLFLFDRLRLPMSHNNDVRISPVTLLTELTSDRTLPLETDCNYQMTDGWFGDIEDRFYKHCVSYDTPKARCMLPRAYAVKEALNEGQPVIASIYVHEQMLAQKGDWSVHDWPIETNTYNRGLGYCMVLIVGYDDNVKRFKCETNLNIGELGLRYDRIDQFENECWTLVENPVHLAKVQADSNDKAREPESEPPPALPPGPPSYSIVATRALSYSGRKKTNIINMFNKPRPKGLGLDVTCDTSTIVTTSDGKVQVGRKGAAYIHKGKVGDNVSISFLDNDGTRHYLLLQFVNAGKTQTVILR